MIGPQIFLQQNMQTEIWKYINLSHWETEHYNSVLERTVSFLGIHKWEPDIYIGFSTALHLQCVFLVYSRFGLDFYVLHISNSAPTAAPQIPLCRRMLGLNTGLLKTLQLKIRRKSEILKVLMPKINL
jgi:hypothetical protein